MEEEVSIWDHFPWGCSPWGTAVGAVNTSCRFRDEQGILCLWEFSWCWALLGWNWFYSVFVTNSAGFSSELIAVKQTEFIDVKVKSAWFILFLMDSIWSGFFLGEYFTGLETPVPNNFCIK